MCLDKKGDFVQAQPWPQVYRDNNTPHEKSGVQFQSVAPFQNMHYFKATLLSSNTSSYGTDPECTSDLENSGLLLVASGWLIFLSVFGIFGNGITLCAINSAAGNKKYFGNI